MNVQDARQQTLGEILRRTARRDPDRLAIVCGETRWTYAELDARCDALARALMRRGVAAGDRVAVLARNSTVVDRKKDMIKTGGENVASREVEEMICRLPPVSEVAVIGLKDPVWVEAVTAIIVLKEGATLDEAAVVAHCKASGAGFKAPKRVIFAPSLPKTPSGKVLKRDLRKAFDER